MKLFWIIGLTVGMSVAVAKPKPPISATIRCQFGAQADFFVFFYGGQSHHYTNSFCSTVPQAQIPGLQMGQTVYASAIAYVHAVPSAYAKEVFGVVTNGAVIQMAPMPPQ